MGVPRGVGAILGDFRGVGGVRDVLWAGSDSRYSGARRGIGASGALGAPRGCNGCYGVSEGVGVYWGAGRDCQYSWARRGIGGIRGHWGLLWCGVLGPLGESGGVGGVRGVLGWQVDWEPNHIGPQSRDPALPLVPLGE